MQERLLVLWHHWKLVLRHHWKCTAWVCAVRSQGAEVSAQWPTALLPLPLPLLRAVLLLLLRGG